MSEPIFQKKTVVFFATAFSASSPLTYSLYQAIPHLIAAGWRCVVVAGKADVPASTEVRLLLPPEVPAFLGSKRLAVNYLARKLRREMPEALFVGVQTVPFDLDLTVLHFIHGFRVEKQSDIGFSHLRESVAFLRHGWESLVENFHFEIHRHGNYAAVADSGAAYLRQRLPEARVWTVANCYDPARFNPGIRFEIRTAERQRLALRDRDVVFAFLSQGHYERKGFWRAVAALKLLRAAKEPRRVAVKFLVIGGRSTTLDRLKRRLDREQPDWREWVIFTGDTKLPEGSLSAADALLFPSYYEGFSLAEIEAAALGLPLFLTRHGGSEMILSEGENGLFLPDEPSAMAGRLADYLLGRTGLGDFDLHQRVGKNFHPSLGRALAPAAFAQGFAKVLDEIRAAKFARA